MEYLRVKVLMPLKSSRARHPLIIHNNYERQEIINSIAEAVKYNIKTKEPGINPMTLVVEEVDYSSDKTSVVVCWTDRVGNSFRDVLYYDGFFDNTTYKIH